MDFEYKCYLQKIFSSLPGGEKLNYFFQKNISKSLPVKNEKVMENVHAAFQHYGNFEKYNRLETKGNKYYEFGAGWDLIIPLSISFLNFEVHCIDIKNLIIPELIFDSIEKFKINKAKLPFERGNIRSFDKYSKEKLLTHLENAFNLHYDAPSDARSTSFNGQYFDFISSSMTLEHIPKNDILLILKECYRMMKKGVVLSMTIDYQDHWSYFDNSISVYNYLKYSAKEWEKYNPSLHFQNRLRHPDYLELISQTDFNVAKVTPVYPLDKAKKQLESLRLDNDYQKYDFNDLSIICSEIVLVK